MGFKKLLIYIFEPLVEPFVDLFKFWRGHIKELYHSFNHEWEYYKQEKIYTSVGGRSLSLNVTHRYCKKCHEVQHATMRGWVRDGFRPNGVNKTQSMTKRLIEDFLKENGKV